MIHNVAPNIQQWSLAWFSVFLLSMTSGMMETYMHFIKFKKNIIKLILVAATLSS